MEARYNAAIKAGVIGGVILAAYAVLTLVAAVLSIGIISGACGCLFYPFILIVGAGTGALAVMYGANVITKWMDAVVTSAVAGAIAGVIFGVVYVVVQFLTPLVAAGTSAITSGTSDIGSQLAGSAGLSALTGGCACVCGIVWLAVIIILAVIGGLIYAALKLKLT